ncbi:MAG: glucose-1-phosphate adenylyltransferase [Pirellulaceae bacterium]|jgi:glucose-1-phosphate adenylyltransferase
MITNAIAVVLAGGVGSRLAPLTDDRAKPAVPFGGQYRIIDFTLSNCLHSGLRKILVLTQYKSHSLQKHLRDGWTVFNPSLGEYITPVPPQMRTGQSWYEGTADAVYQNLYLLERSDAEYVVILSGDHIYRMDYGAMVEFHKENNADVTIACMKVPLEDAKSFGVMGVDSASQVVDFAEKPSSPKTIPGDDEHALASMGIYVFSRKLLCEKLHADHEEPLSSHDFGSDLLPQLIKTHRVFGYPFGGDMGRVTTDSYWRDVGTIDAYYRANMDLLEAEPAMDLYQAAWTIRACELQAPPARAVPSSTGYRADIQNCILGAGSVIRGATVNQSIVFPVVRIEEEATVMESILFDRVTVSSGARLRKCIIDKGVVVPPGECIGYDRFADRKLFHVSEGGIIVIPKGFQFEERAEPKSTFMRVLRESI